LREARRLAEDSDAQLRIAHDPGEAVTLADAVYADVWASMGEESERSARAEALGPFEVTHELMAAAQPHAIFLHCLPAYREQEVEGAVIDGPQSRSEERRVGE